MAAAMALNKAVGHACPEERRVAESIIPRLRDTLGEEEFRPAWDEGESMGCEEAIGYALECLRSFEPSHPSPRV